MESLSGIPMLEVEVRLQLESRVERDPCGRQRAAVGSPSLLARHPPRRTGDRRDAAVFELEQVLHRLLGT
jgi:hypothetical protein